MEELAIRREGSPAALTHTLRDAVAPVFRKRRLASLIFVGIFLGAVLGGLLVPRKYEAEMKILVNRDRVDAVVTPDPDAPMAAAPVAVVSEEDMNSEVELLRSRDVLEKVALACGLDSRKETAWDRIGDVMRGTKPTGERQLARSVETLEGQLVVEPLKKTTLIRVAYASNDPQLSARVLETLATFYQEKHAAVHRPAGTFDFFDQQTTRYLGELQAAEARLEQFDGEEGVVSPAAEKQLALEQVSQFEAELQQDQANAYGAERRAQALEAEAAALPQRQTTQTTEQDNGELLAQLKNTLLSLELKAQRNAGQVRAQLSTRAAGRGANHGGAKCRRASRRFALAGGHDRPRAGTGLDGHGTGQGGSRPRRIRSAGGCHGARGAALRGDRAAIG